MSGFGNVAHRAPVTTGLLMSIVAIFLLQAMRLPLGAVLETYGALDPQRVARGEVWRLLTYAFLHANTVHILFNGYFLFLIGPQTEISMGSARYLLLFGVTAVGGGVLASLWSPSWVVGASGALFGMLGALLAINMRRGRHLLEFWQYGGPRQLVSLIVINLVIGAVFPMISNACHVGGLLTGFVLFFVFLERGRHHADRLTRVIQVGWAALFVSLLLWCVEPVTSRGALLDGWRTARDPQRREEYAWALLQTVQRRGPMSEPISGREQGQILDDAESYRRRH